MKYIVKNIQDVTGDNKTWAKHVITRQIPKTLLYITKHGQNMLLKDKYARPNLT